MEIEAITMERDEQKKIVAELKEQIVKIEQSFNDAQDKLEKERKTIEEMNLMKTEMKALIDQERSIYNDNREKLEQDLERL